MYRITNHGIGTTGLKLSMLDRFRLASRQLVSKLQGFMLPST